MVHINPRTVIALMNPTSGAKFELYPLYARCRSLFSTVFFSSWISHFFHFEKSPSLRRAEHSRLFRRANTTIAPLRRRSSDSESDEDGTILPSRVFEGDGKGVPVRAAQTQSSRGDEGGSNCLPDWETRCRLQSDLRARFSSFPLRRRSKKPFRRYLEKCSAASFRSRSRWSTAVNCAPSSDWPTHQRSKHKMRRGSRKRSWVRKNVRSTWIVVV